MSANTFGKRFCVTTFGESHGVALGCVIDGCPAGLVFDEDLLVNELRRRRPGTSKAVSSRQEEDIPQVLSGVFEGKTLGTPIAIVVNNKDARPEDYRDIRDNPRPGHADDVWREKFGHVDWRGGGRASGRETVTRVMAGAVAQMLVRNYSPETKVKGTIKSIGSFPSLENIEELLIQAKEKGESYGGVIEISVDGFPQGLGQPVFHKLKSDFAHALMSVGATTGFEIGSGFAGVSTPGTRFHASETDQSQYGGIRGGISTGERIMMRVAIKPPASVLDVAKKGRHDPCIVPRVLPVLESMCWIVLADHFLWRSTDCV